MNIQHQMRSATRHLKNDLNDISPQILKYAKGIVFITILKGAFIWSGSFGTGIITRRIDENHWSPPCSVCLFSVGFGLQAGGEKVDVIIVLAEESEIEVFASNGQLKLGVEYGMAAGPIGRDMDLSAYMGSRGLSCSLYFSKSMGAFFGISLEGAMLVSRWTANRSFYGKSVSVSKVLRGEVPVQEEHEQEFDDFQNFLINYEKGRVGNRIITKESKEEEEPNPEVELHEVLSAQNTILAHEGRSILCNSLLVENSFYVFIADHIIDESDQNFARYNIISAKMGDKAILIEGTLDNGLPVPLQDYVKIRLTKSNGSTCEGLVSRYVLQKSQS